MKNIIFLLVIGVLNFSCNAQKVKVLELNETDEEVVSIFLEEVKAYTFVDKHFFNENLITEFIEKYKYHQRFQRNADSICRLSQEIDKKKFYCPLADNLFFFKDLFDESDLTYLSENYNNDGKILTMQIDSILNHKQLKTHSKNYYKNVDYNDNSYKTDVQEYPSIRIQNLYYNKNKSLAIVAYSNYNISVENDNNFFILKMIDDVWWKPLGSFKL